MNRILDFYHINRINLRHANCALIEAIISRNHEIRLQVCGCSMLPSLKNGDVVVVRIGESNYSFGDIVLVKSENSFIIHRLISNQRKLIKGDNNSNFDKSEFEIIGKVIAKKNLFIKLGTLVSYVEGKANCRWRKYMKKIKFWLFDKGKF